MHTPEKILNIKLNPQSLILYEDVQKLYGKEIKLDSIDSSDPYFCGESEVIGDGVPNIRISNSTIFKEETLVHEIFHLKLRKEGFPRYHWAKVPVPGFWADPDAAEWLLKEVRDPIQHSIFFPEMKKIGVDPFGNMKMLFSRILKTGNFISRNDPIINAAIFMRLVLETDDKELAYQLEQYFKKYGLADSIKKGKELISMIKAMKPQRPKEEVDTFVKCVNALFKGKTSVQVWEWGTKKVGSHTDCTVTILVTPYYK